MKHFVTQLIIIMQRVSLCCHAGTSRAIDRACVWLGYHFLQRGA